LTQYSRRQQDKSSKRGLGRPCWKDKQEPIKPENNQVSKQDLQVALRSPKAPLCGDLSLLKKHVKGIAMRRNYPKRFVKCGQQAYRVCTLCNNKKGQNTGSSCFINYHNDSFFGLAYYAIKLVNKSKREWLLATPKKQRKNKKYIKNLKGDNDDCD
jgi:hypothetical protein